MNLKNVNVKEEYEFYQTAAPLKVAHLKGGDFAYRYYKNPNPKLDVTIICFAGGSGLADALCLMFRELGKRYHFVCFNYPKSFTDNDSLADAVAELIRLEHLKNVYLLGQSYGGLIAQVIAKKHPELIKGLILSSTCSLSNDISYQGVKCLYNMINEQKQQKNQKMDKMLPSFILVPFMRLAFKKHIPDKDTRRVLLEILYLIKDQIQGDYMYLMDGLLGDLRNHFGTHTKEDFKKFKNEVLIISPDDDPIFSPDLKQAMFRLMTEPEVITDFEGGHLALMISPDKYFALLDDFLQKRN